MLALAIGKEKGTISEDFYLKILREMGNIPDKIGAILAQNDKIADFAKHLHTLPILSIWVEVTISPWLWKVL